MRPTVTVILCAYTTERDRQLMAALESVRGQLPPPDEVLVVIDHNDDLESWMQGQVAALGPGGPPTRVVASTGAKGLSGARNTGLQLASCDVVAFLDDDAEAEPGWLDHMLSPYSDPAVMAVGGWVIPAWETARPDWFPDEFGWVVGCSYRGLPTAPAQIRNPIGANMSFRRSALASVGGFSTSIGRTGADAMGCEETEVSIRVSRAVPGSRIVLAPAARVRHHVPASRASWTYFRKRCFAEGRSKALVSTLVGRDAGLEAERSYVRSTLPTGVSTALARSWQHREVSELAPAAAIVGGLVATASGYALATIRTSLSRRTTTA